MRHLFQCNTPGITDHGALPNVLLSTCRMSRLSFVVAVLVVVSRLLVESEARRLRGPTGVVCINGFLGLSWSITSNIHTTNLNSLHR